MIHFLENEIWWWWFLLFSFFPLPPFIVFFFFSSSMTVSCHYCSLFPLHSSLASFIPLLPTLSPFPPCLPLPLLHPFVRHILISFNHLISSLCLPLFLLCPSPLLLIFFFSFLLSPSFLHISSLLLLVQKGSLWLALLLSSLCRTYTQNNHTQ